MSKRDERIKGAELMKARILQIIGAAEAGNTLAGGHYGNVLKIIREGVEATSPSSIVSVEHVREDAARRGVHSPI